MRRNIIVLVITSLLIVGCILILTIIETNFIGLVTMSVLFITVICMPCALCYANDYCKQASIEEFRNSFVFKVRLKNLIMIIILCSPYFMVEYIKTQVKSYNKY